MRTTADQRETDCQEAARKGEQIESNDSEHTDKEGLMIEVQITRQVDCHASVTLRGLRVIRGFYFPFSVQKSKIDIHQSRRYQITGDCLAGCD